jgi:DNA-binding beta-propeller fold protein YncE
MRIRLVGALSLLVLGACRTTAGAPREAPPLVHEGEVLLYLQPTTAEPDRLEFSITSVAAIAGDGAVRPLEIVHGDVTWEPPPRQRLLARGRLAPGTYAGFTVSVGRATLARNGVRSDLLVSADPARIGGAFTIVAGEATVLWATLRARESLGTRYGFSPVLTVAPPPAPIPDLVGYCTNTATNDVTVFDRVRHQVVGVVVTGPAPRGIALDELARRAFVASSAAANVDVIDVAASRIVGRIRLGPGDGPWGVALTPDGRVLASANHDSNAVSFLDPDSWLERRRVPTGDFPTEIVVDRSGKRAFVLNSGASSITVLDLGYGAVAATLATESEPVRAALNRDGTVMFVALRGSPYVSAISVPGFAPLRRIYVGPGASGVLVDPRTDRLYVGVSGQKGIQVFEPGGSTAVGFIELPAPVTEMVILNAEHVMLALMPTEQAVAAVDLTNGRIVSVFDVGRAPHDLAVTGARR